MYSVHPDDLAIDAGYIEALLADPEFGDSPADVVARREALTPGGVFVLDGAGELAVRWGSTTEVLWASGESVMIVAPPGVGKTTVAIQLVEALIGLRRSLLGLPVIEARKVLYLAMDRPRQIARAMARLFGPEERALLDERLVVHRGPLPVDLAVDPAQLLALARRVGADVVVVDSLKDACAKLTDDESGSMVNRAVQWCNAEGVDVCVLHHQRKGQGGTKPNTLADVYGSTWLTAGTGSVILLWGEAGSELVELHHLKQPADPVGPWHIEHDHHTGRSVIARGFDPLAFIRGRPGATVTDAAQAEHGAPQKPGSAKYKQTERKLRRLTREGLITVTHDPGSAGSFGAATYWPVDTFPTVDTHRGHPEVTDD